MTKEFHPPRTASDSRRTALVFAVLGALWLVAAVVAPSIWVRALEIWAALVFGFLSFVFWSGSGRWFGKRANGTLPLWHWIVLAPYQVLNWASLILYWWFNRGDWIQEIAPNLWLGARLPASFAMRMNHIRCVLDVAAELTENRKLRAAPIYRSYPTLDKLAPADLETLADWINMQRAQGEVFVHCAAGRGRSAVVVAATLRRSGEAASVDEALKMIQRARNIELSASQREALARVDNP